MPETALLSDWHTDRLTRLLYATDASMYQMEPRAVFIPQDEAALKAGLAWARAMHWPVIARGSGTGLGGQAIGHGLVVDFTRHLNQILDFNPEERWIRVQPGLILDDLNRFLKPHGLQFGPDPASSSRATLGGMMGNNATGSHSILYGSVVDHVLEAEVVLNEGTCVTFSALDETAWTEKCALSTREGQLYQDLDALLRENETVIRRDTPRHWRRAGGYRLERLGAFPRNPALLLCGAEGTLGVVTAMKLNLVRLPRCSGMGVLHFETRHEALEAVEALLTTRPAAIELLDRVAYERCRDVPDFADKLGFIQGNPEALLTVEYFGESPEAVAEQVEALARLRPDWVITRALSDAVLQNVRSVRKGSLGLVMGVKGDLKPVPFIEDAAVPVAHLPAYIAELEAYLAQLGRHTVVYAHASAGCLHVRPFFNVKSEADWAHMVALAQFSAARVRAYGGTISSEHGDGLVRGWLAEAFYGTDLYRVYQALKRIFDPNNLLNPGKVVNAPPMTEWLRTSPKTTYIPLEPHLDFGEQGSFVHAAERCNGAGVCRKLEGGAMCPSFRATQQERDSTRGRANVLRLALTGKLPLDGAEMRDVMSLCVSCKACKAECPSSVDLAALKFEWQSQYWETHRMPLRERVFAHFPRLMRMGSGWKAPLINRIAQFRVTKRVLGVARDRKLPEISARPFKRKQHPNAPTVVLWADCFNAYLSPEVSEAALRVLERAGERVQVLTDVCCGRTLISGGLAEKARVQAKKLLDVLHPIAAQGIPVVGLEPSCVLSLRDEYKALCPNDARVDVVAQQAKTFEEFVTARAETEAWQKLRWTDAPRKILVHGHCHQKALSDLRASRRALSLPPQYDVRILDTGCCGMAGAFGYKTEHQAVSRQMAEHVLAPEIRAAAPDVIVVASGASCTAQIAHVTHREAWHPAQVLADALAP